VALTETNLNYLNSKDSTLNAHGFLAGQFWCELMAVALEQELHFLGFWSVVKNSLGYIDESSGRFWPTYHHYKLAATHLKGNYYKVQVKNAPHALKALSSADRSGIVVIIMNQLNNKETLPFSLEIGKVMNKDKGSTLTIPDLPGLNGTIQYKDVMPPMSTQLLVFDYSGKLIKKLDYAAADGAQPPRNAKKLKQPVFTPVKAPGANE
jgi:hypothetical protein